MKYCILFSLFISLSCFGQSQAGFVDSNARWSVARTYPFVTSQNPNFVQTTTLVYGFRGDSIWSNKSWGKLFSTSDTSFSINFKFLGLLREENGQVFFKDSVNTPKVLYNFNMQAGDTLTYTHQMGTNDLYVLSVDSIYYGNAFHKRINFSPIEGWGFNFLEETWIEGIGSIHGPLFPANPLVFFPHEIPDSLLLTCYKSNDTIVWNNPDYLNCFVNIILSENEIPHRIQDLQIYPNPVTDELFVLLPESTGITKEISIIDVSGRLIRKDSWNSENPVRIETRILESGVYFLQLESAGKIFRSKFVKLQSY